LNKKILKNQKWYFLDIWCWSWFLKDKVELYWWKYFWFEIAWNAFKKKYIRYNQDIIEENFDWKKFDYIYMSHVFEHLDNPIGTLDKLSNILNPNWIIHILVPNIDSYSAKLFGKYVAERDIPRHLFSYTKKWLDILFQSKWFEIIESKYVLQMCWYLSFMRLFKNEKRLKFLRFLRMPLWVIVSIFDFFYSIFAKKTNQLQYYIKIKK
jgi:predicted SAM-dependent methyltransferase